MSRIGLSKIIIPEGVTITADPTTVTVKGPKAEHSIPLPRYISVGIDGNSLSVKRANNTKNAKSLHGLTRSLIANMVEGVTNGYEKILEMVGTGYRVNKQGKKLVISVGFSHDVEFIEPDGIQLILEGNNIIKIQGTDKQLVGHTAAEIRHIRPPEPYKGKGIRYQGERVRRKAGKAAKTEGAGE